MRVLPTIGHKKKAARFPGRPFLSYGGATFERAISELPHEKPLG
jgi:hypothetical protein